MKSPGPDRLPNFWIKQLKSLHKPMVLKMSTLGDSFMLSGMWFQSKGAEYLNEQAAKVLYLTLGIQNMQIQALSLIKQLVEPWGSQYASTGVGRHEIHILSLIWDMSFETY